MTRHPRVWESFFVFRPQSGSEHELTDPLTSLCCLAPVLRCMFVWRPNTSFCRCWGGAAGLFSFLPRLRRKFCRAVQADFLLVFSLLVSLTRFVTRATLSVYFEGSHIRQCSCCSFCHAMVWNPSLARGSRCSRRVRSTREMPERSCGRSA